MPLWQAIVFSAAAGGLAWGIRGQYGHETGAMLAGLLIGLVLTLLFTPRANSLATARAVALCTVAMGFGGSETYGQTVGLTQDSLLIGNWLALQWGLLGLAIKGGIWIGFAGAFLGIGLSGRDYRSRELLFVMLGMIGLSFLGTWLINEPFQPAEKVLPSIYFSADWRWQPDAELKPRREIWGGLLCSLAGLLAYLRLFRRDSLALRLGLWGLLGGAIGFPLGQGLQAFHDWNPEIFSSGIWLRLDPLINWWNFMETTFGTVMGGTLGLGVWLNRHRISVATVEPPSAIAPWAEVLLMALHVVLLLSTEFDIVPQLGWIYDFGLFLGLLPIVAIVGGKWWPYWTILPITVLPIAGKTLRNLTYEQHVTSVDVGWLFFVIVPLTITTIVATYFARDSQRRREARSFLRTSLMLTTWIYFCLNFAFFRYPWLWSEWTRRTPNGLVFTACAIALTILAFDRSKSGSGDGASAS